MPDGSRRRGILRKSDAGIWNSTGWKILKLSTTWFTGLAFLASFAAMRSGGVTFNGIVVEGWAGVWFTTGIAAIAGLLFGCIWLILFKALALAAKGK